MLFCTVLFVLQARIWSCTLNGCSEMFHASLWTGISLRYYAFYVLQLLKIHLTAGDSPKLLEQLDVGVRLDSGGDVRFAAGGVQQGVVVEQAGLVGSLHCR